MTLIPTKESIDRLQLEIANSNRWLPLDEFLKSGFDGWCWFSTDQNEVSCAYFDKGGVRESITSNMAWTYDGIHTSCQSTNRSRRDEPCD